MSDINLLLAQNPDFKFVKCSFGPTSNQLYTYKTLEAVEAGQFVVVDTPKRGMQVVEVVKVCKLHEIKLNPLIDYRWLVQVIDRAKYDDVVNRENEAQEVLNSAKTKVLVTQMQEELKSSIGQEALDTVTKLVRL